MIAFRVGGQLFINVKLNILASETFCVVFKQWFLSTAAWPQLPENELKQFFLWSPFSPYHPISTVNSRHCTGSEEREILGEILGVGSIPIAILPSCQDMKAITL